MGPPLAPAHPQAALPFSPDCFAGSAVLAGGGERPRAGSYGSPFLIQRVRTLLRVSRQFGSGVPLDDLVWLLPPDGPRDRTELRDWLLERPDLARIDGARAFPPEGEPSDIPERLARAGEYHVAAATLVHDHLRAALPLVRCVGITGSTSYGTPESEDDLDLLVVTRTGTLWLFLAYAYFVVRIRYRTNPVAGRPRPCFNYSFEEEEGGVEMSAPRGFLFAREALTAPMIVGEEYYRSLLASAPWMERELPRLFSRRTSGILPQHSPSVPWPLRLLNATLFPFLACYVRFGTMYRNARVRRDGHPEREFRARFDRRRLAFLTPRFDELANDLDPASTESRGGAGMAVASRTTASR